MASLLLPANAHNDRWWRAESRRAESRVAGLKVQVSGSCAALPLNLRDHLISFQRGRHLYTAIGYRAVMKTSFAVWEEVIGVQLAA